jgi:uncharacterized protein
VSSRLTTDETTDAPAQVSLHLEVDAPDGSLFVYLEEVQATGRVNYVTEGQLRLCHRKTVGDSEAGQVIHSFLRRDAIPMDGIQRVDVALHPTSYTFRRGSRVRVALAGSDVDNFMLPRPADKMPKVFRVFHTQQLASTLSLPCEPDDST